MLILIQGASSIIGTPLTGLIHDYTGNYDICFFVAGGFFILASIIGFVAQIMNTVAENREMVSKL